MKCVSESYNRGSNRLRFTYDPQTGEIGGRDAEFLYFLARRATARPPWFSGCALEDPLGDPARLGRLLNTAGYRTPANWPEVQAQGSPRKPG